MGQDPSGPWARGTALLNALRTDLEKAPFIPQDRRRKRPAILAVRSRGELGILVTVGANENAKDHQARSRPAKYSPMGVAKILSRLDAIHENYCGTGPSNVQFSFTR